MHRVLALSVLFTVIVSASATPRLHAGKSSWYTSYAAGKAEARRTGKPMMLVFRCHP